MAVDLLTILSSMTGISLTIPDSEMNVIQVDGGPSVVSHPANSVGVLYPAERVDLVLSWPESAGDLNSEIVIELDAEYVQVPSDSFCPLSSNKV